MTAPSGTSPSPEPSLPEAAAEALAGELEATRRLTLRLVAAASDEELRTAWHGDFSPVGWHLGHVAAFEAGWVLERAHGEPPLPAAVRERFDPRATPKPRRTELPVRAALLELARDVRRRTLGHLASDAARGARGTLVDGGYVYRFVLAHEQQHAETMATVLRLRPAPSRERSGFPLPAPGPFRRRAPLHVPGGSAMIGSARPDAYDNERGTHEVQLEPLDLDGQPATNADWLEFIASGGYLRRELWSEAGWAWLARARVCAPSTWLAAPRGHLLRAMGGDAPLPLSHPVEGVAAFEAEAYARFRGGRLPTEAEWEAAAHLAVDASPRLGLVCGATRAVGEAPDLLGNVWEWTASTFAPYPGFRPFPYDGYSATWFDGCHRVLRGGSWATQARVATPTFRNWYPPGWREMFAGVRVARDACARRPATR